MSANENINRMLKDIHDADTPKDDAWYHAIETAVCSLLRAKKQDNIEATRRHGVYDMPDGTKWHSGTGEVTSSDQAWCIKRGWHCFRSGGGNFEFERHETHGHISNIAESVVVHALTADDAWKQLAMRIEAGEVGVTRTEPNVNEDEWTEINRLHDMLHNSKGIDKETLRALLADVRDRLAMLILKRGNRVPQTAFQRGEGEMLRAMKAEPDARTRAWRGMVDDLVIAPGTPTFDHHFEHRQLDDLWYVENVGNDGREIVAGPIVAESTARQTAENMNRQRKPAP